MIDADGNIEFASIAITAIREGYSTSVAKVNVPYIWLQVRFRYLGCSLLTFRLVYQADFDLKILGRVCLCPVSI